MADGGWSEVRRLFEAAIERPASERETFLDQATDDAELRREVSALLAADARDAGFLKFAGDAAREVIAELSPGRPGSGAGGDVLAPGCRIGAYDVIELIGAGGMGQVYRARDTRLHRDVAIKVLPAVPGDSSARDRFIREARMLAALKHPNIGAIYGVEESNESFALILELIEGQTLADRLATGALSIADAIHIASQVADGLAAAHAKGILHLDLKPANIKFDMNGQLKILDFGLARSITPALTTLEAAADEGAMFGTIGYMSPERARGEPVDERTDIWSFGCILFELLGGRPAFAVGTMTETLSRVLNEEPDWRSLRSAAPRRLIDLARRCVEKDRARRPASIAAVKAALHPTARRRVLAAAAAVVVIAAGALGARQLALRQTPRSASQAVHSRVTFLGNVRDAALAPDGQSIAYVREERGIDRLMVQSLSGGSTGEVDHGRLRAPRWSPDGRSVAYWSDATLTVSRLAGEPKRVARGTVFAWSPDGTQVVVSDTNQRAFRIISITGQETGRVQLPSLRRLLDLDWNAATNRIVLVAFDDRQLMWSLWISKPDGSEVRQLRSTSVAIVAARWAPDGSALYVQQHRNNTELVKIRADATAAEPEVLLSGLDASASLSLAANGTRLLLTRGLEYSNLWMVSLTGDGAVKQITQGTSDFWMPKVSPDGRWIVSGTGAGSNDTIAKLAINGGDLIPLTAGESQADNSPSWSPDGHNIVYATDRGGSPSIWTMRADGSGQRKLDTSPVSSSFLVTWAPDGRIAWQTNVSDTELNFRVRDLTTGVEEFLVPPGTGSVGATVFSRRGDQVAVMRWGRNQSGLWLLSWPGRKARFVSNRIVSLLGWSADGRSVFGVDESLHEVIRIATDSGQANTVASVATGRITTGDVTPDGRSAVCSVREYHGDAWLIDHFDPAWR